MRPRLAPLLLAAAALAPACGGGSAPAGRFPADAAGAEDGAGEEGQRAEPDGGGGSGADETPEAAALREHVAELEAQVRRLEASLTRERTARTSREEQWLRFSQSVARLDLRDLVEDWSVHLPLQEEAPEPLPQPDPEARRDRERAREMLVSLRNLLRIDEVYGLDPLELGTLVPGGVGPVVFRLLDDRGRLRGSLNAERLRLEASRAAHTVTLVLEEGFESTGGERAPFDGGERRVVLPHVRPDRWAEALPELFLLEDRTVPADDGLWDLQRVRRALNDRLRVDAAGGFYHLRRVGAIRGRTFHDVQLSGFDASGRLERRLFADRMRLLRESRGVQVLLEDGAVVRGDQTEPFPGGTFRVFLPSARHELWEGARLPGFWSPIAGPADPDEADGEEGPGRG